MGESVTEATISKWFKKEGDAVKRDEPLLELETDKVTVEVPSPTDGAIESISAQAGATVQVGALLGAIAEGKRRRAPAAVKRRPKRRGGAPAAPPAHPKAEPRPCRRPSAFPKNPACPVLRRRHRPDGRVTKGDMLGRLPPAPARRRRPPRPCRPAPQ
jgi:2-oxoglutarate dehydrogenase E2 component (dihydrolipoamide succinyltransferase)